MTTAACIAPGSDPVHPRDAGQAAHRLLPNAELHQVVTDDHPDIEAAFADLGRAPKAAPRPGSSISCAGTGGVDRRRGGKQPLPLAEQIFHPITAGARTGANRRILGVDRQSRLSLALQVRAADRR